MPEQGEPLVRVHGGRRRRSLGLGLLVTVGLERPRENPLNGVRIGHQVVQLVEQRDAPQVEDSDRVLQGLELP